MAYAVRPPPAKVRPGDAAEREQLRARLDVYRGLLRRDAQVPEIGRLVDLLEAELREAPAGPPARRRR